ncbi:MAG: hypothetical protein Q8P12_01615 [bacterium]|nr:hypothetical protein [bacterium]
MKGGEIMANRTVRLRVDGWSNPRFGRVEDNLIAFEVVWLGCACATCFGRLTAVENRMSESKVEWTVQEAFIPARGGAPSLILVVKPERMPEEVDTYLSDLLGLEISEVALAS